MKPPKSKLARVAFLAGTALTSVSAIAGDLPTGGTVAHGSVDISTPGPKRMVIRQSSQDAIVNWTGFSVDKAARVDIAQPAPTSSMLNRVTGRTPSTIAGQVNANGRVYLVNPNGIVIGKTGSVRAGAFVASTLDIADEAFLDGRREFTGNGRSAAVENHGAIEIGSGGYAALLGGRVENSGTISVPLGRIGLGAGERITLDVSGDGFLQVLAPTEGDDDDALIDHSGRLTADGGRVEIKAAAARNAARHAVNLSGIVEARTVSGRSGAIVLGGGGGQVTVTGRLDVSARRPAAVVQTSRLPAPRPGRGGEVTITGRAIALAGATIDASGTHGGGHIRIGGDLRGEGPLRRSSVTYVDGATRISADATGSGDGGRVIVWSDALTTYGGEITARGGPDGGDGGFAEVSGKAVLSYAGTVDLTAPAGKTGTLLLDPWTIYIEDVDPDANENIAFDPTSGADLFLSVAPQVVVQATDQGDTGLASNPSATAGNDSPDLVASDGNTSILDSDILVNQLAISDVIVQTGSGGSELGNITVGAPLSWDETTTLTLSTLNDDEGTVGNIIIARPIIAQAGGLALQAQGNVTTPTAWLDSDGEVNSDGNGAIDVDTFRLLAGDWVQNAADLPDFAANDFGIRGGTFLRVIGGNGDSTAFQVADVYGLQGIDTRLGAPYALAGDIDATGTENWNDAAGFDPIGSNEQRFGGSFDGAGNSIDGLYIERPSMSYVGLFGVVGDGATVQDVGLTSQRLLGGAVTGGLAGANYGEITRSSVENNFTFLTSNDGSGLAGAFVGYNAGEVSQSYVTFANVPSLGLEGDPSPDVDIPGLISDSAAFLGGFVGYNDGIVTQAFSGPLNIFGDEGFIDYIGGFVGYNAGSISQAYSLASVDTEGAAAAGGFAGANAGLLSQTFATGLISGSATATGGLVGRQDEGGSASESFWDADTTGVDSTAGNGTALTTTEFQDTDGFIDLARPDWSFEQVWAPSAEGRYPDLYSVSPVVWADPDDTTAVYGDDVALTGTVYGGPDVYVFDSPDDSLGDDPVPFVSPGLPDPNVGTYPIVAGVDSVVSAEGQSYDVVSSIGELTVTPAPLTVFVGDAEKTYGVEFDLSTVGFTADGLVNGDEVTSVTLSSAGAPATAAVAGSPYDIVATAAAGPGLSVGGVSNYAFAFEDGLLTVTPAPLTVAVGDASKVYGVGLTPGALAAAAGFTADGLVNGDEVTSVTLSSAGAPATAAVAGSPYDIVATAAAGPGLSVGGVSNYAFAFEDGLLTVTPAPLTVAVGDASKVYGVGLTPGALAAAAGFTADGLVNGDEVTSVTLSSAGAPATAAVAGSPYDIVATAAAGPGLSVGGVSNYAFAFEDGLLSVTPAPLTVAVGDASKVYGVGLTPGALAAAAGFTADGLVNGDEVTSVTLSSAGAPATAAVAGSPYDIVATAAAGPGLSVGGVSNYAFAFEDGLLTVTPAPLTVAVGDASKVYGVGLTPGALAAAAGFTADGLVNGDEVTSVTLSSAGAPATAAVAGSPYDIVATAAAGPGLSVGGVSNYAFAFEDGLLTVTPAPLTVAVGDASKVYGVGLTPGALAAAAGFTADGLVNGDEVTSVTLSSAGAPATAAVAGSPYDIVATAAAGPGLSVGGVSNYAFAFEDGLLTVTPAPLTVAVGDASKVYGVGLTPGALAAAAGFTAGGLVNGDEVTSVTLSSAGAPATAAVAGSPYDIVATAAAGPGLSVGGVSNYAFAFEDGLLTVTPAPLTVAANNQAKFFGSELLFDGTEFAVVAGELLNGDTISAVTLSSEGAPAAAPVAGSPYAIGIEGARGPGFSSRGIANYEVDYLPGELFIRNPPEQELLVSRLAGIVPPRNPSDVISTNLAGVVEASLSGPDAAGSLATAEDALAFVQRISDELEAVVAACGENQPGIDEYLACVSGALDRFAVELDARVVDLPEELRQVSAIIRQAAQEIEVTRADAARRIAAAATPEEIRAIEREAGRAARASIRTAGAEINKVIALIRADEPQLASLEREQGAAIAGALQTVELELARVVGL